MSAGLHAVGGGFGLGAAFAAVQLEAGLTLEQARERQADESLVVDQQNRRVWTRRTRIGPLEAGHDQACNRPDPSELEERPRRWFRAT